MDKEKVIDENLVRAEEMRGGGGDERRRRRGKVMRGGRGEEERIGDKRRRGEDRR